MRRIFNGGGARGILLAAALGLAFSLALSAPAAQAENIFQGKTLRLVVASDAGGGYDSYARTFAQYLPRHLPGTPTIIIQNMPGAGGLVATNWLYNVAPKDGLTIGLSQRGVPFYPYFGEKNAHFSPTAMNWLGSFNSETGVVAIWKTAAVKTMADALTRTVLLGGSGPNDSETYPYLMNRTVGSKFKVVSGYKANTDVLLAMERGEVEGISGSWSSLKSGRPQWLRDHQVNLLVQIAREKEADLPNVPLIMDFVKTDTDRAMWNVMLSVAAMGRPLAAPPGTPADVVAQLRAGFDATMKDPAFVAEMAKAHREISPVTGQAMQAMLQDVSKTPATTLQTLSADLKGP
jgi:tripartite-type tricarboxylate transporter receptor subunit TctC